MFGQTPKERDQSEHIKKQSIYINKQNQKIEQLENNQSNGDDVNDWKIKVLEKTIKELKGKIKEVGEMDEEIYFSEMKKAALRDYEKSHFKGKGKKISEQEEKPLTDDEAKARIKKIKDKHKKDDKNDK
jgi:hypothetical protein